MEQELNFVIKKENWLDSHDKWTWKSNSYRRWLRSDSVRRRKIIRKSLINFRDARPTEINFSSYKWNTQKLQSTFRFAVKKWFHFTIYEATKTEKNAFSFELISIFHFSCGELQFFDFSFSVSAEATQKNSSQFHSGHIFIQRFQVSYNLAAGCFWH